MSGGGAASARWRRAARAVSLAVALALLASRLAAASAPTLIPDPKAFVVDQAQALDVAQRQRITDVCQRLQDQTGAELRVLTVASLDGDDPVDFAQRHFDAWKIGRQGKDDGVLVLFAPTEPQVRIHPGYGLEEWITDAWSGATAREARDRWFVAGHAGEGLVFIAEAVATRIAEGEGVALDGVATHPRPRPATDQGSSRSSIVLFIVIALIVVFINRRAQRSGWGGRGGWGMPMILPGGFGGLGGRSSGWGGGWGGGSSGSSGSFGGGGRSGGGGGGASW